MIEKSRRILILSTSFWPLVGGSETAIKEITVRLPDYHFDLVTARFQADALPMEYAANLHIFRAGNRLNFFKFLLPKIFLPLAIFNAARKLLRKEKYDLIHVFQASQAGGAAWLLKKLGCLPIGGCPIVLTLQEGQNLASQPWLTRFFRARIIKNVDRATAISRYLADYLKKTGPNLLVKIIPNGVDLANFAREFSYGELSILADELGLRPGAKIIVSVGRLVPKNGLDNLIGALAVLQNNYPEEDWRLLLVGEGGEKENLTALAHSLAVEKRIIFRNFADHKELPKYLQISHVFVRPSRSEGLGNSFLEAMAAGTPIIGTPVGGIPDFLTDGETGLFCEPERPEDVAAKVKMIIEDENLRRHIVKKARALVEEKYDWDKITQDYRQLYETV